MPRSSASTCPPSGRLYLEVAEVAEGQRTSCRDRLALLKAEKIAHRTSDQVHRSARKAKRSFPSGRGATDREEIGSRIRWPEAGDDQKSPPS